MTVTQKFHNLHGSEVSREDLQDLILEAKESNETEIVYRLSKILLDNPNTDYFDLELTKYPTSLNAPRHKGAYKQALTECGRLKKGWKFEKGNVVKVVKNTRTKTTKKVVKTIAKSVEKTVKPTVKSKIIKTNDFVLNTLSKKFKKQIFSNSINELKRLTTFSDQELATASKNMLSLVNRKHFVLLNLKHGYLRTSDKQEYYNVPVYINKRIYKKNIDDLTSDETVFLLAELKKYSYETAWNDLYSGNFNHIQYNIKKLEKTIKPQQTKLALNGVVSVNTDVYRNMSVSELRKFTFNYYKKNLKDKKVVIEKHLHEVVFSTSSGRKIARGEAMYSEKASVIPKLESLIKNSTYNNWGERKKKDNKEVLGFLNFKSKLIIDGKKRHVRISLTVYKDRETKLKNVEVGKIEKTPKHRQEPVATLQDEDTKTFNSNKDTKKNKPTKKGLGNPTVTVNSLASKLQNRSTKTVNYYDIDDKYIADFLGKVEQKEKESVVITVTGGQGSMKTRFAFRFMNALAQKYKVGHASIEEHPESSLYWNKVHEYISENALYNIQNPEITNVSELDILIKNNDVIVIDSFAKMQELERGFEVDKDLRKKYNGKLFLVIFQQTSDGRMRGGTKSQYDADIVLFTEKFDNYEENYVYADKNRYQNKTLSDLKYNIFKGKLNDIQPIEEE